MSHPFPFSVAASQTHCADRDCCWRRAPVTGVNKRETTLSEIVTVQVLILICQHRLPAPLTVHIPSRSLPSFSHFKQPLEGLSFFGLLDMTHQWMLTFVPRTSPFNPLSCTVTQRRVHTRLSGREPNRGLTVYLVG
jgi:hypothetical protein